MKYFVLLLCLFFSVNFCDAKTYKLGVTYTPQIAKEIAYKNVAKKIDMKKYEKYKIDKDNKIHLENISNGKNNFKNKIITLFSSENYSILYLNNRRVDYLYNKQGELLYINILKGNKFPYKDLCYDSEGRLVSVSLVVSGYEQFVFDTNGELFAHWIGDNCYDIKGNLKKSRIEIKY